MDRKQQILFRAFAKYFYWIIDHLCRTGRSNSFEKEINSNPPILFYNQNKISKGLFDSISTVYPGVVLESNNFSLNNSDWRIRSLYKHALIKKRPIIVITLIHEPISNNLQQFFATVPLLSKAPEFPSDQELEEFTNRFFATYDHEQEIGWFDTMVEPIFKINVYQEEFPESGKIKFERDNVLLLAVKDDDQLSIVYNRIISLIGTVEPVSGEIHTTSNIEDIQYQKIVANFMILPYEYILRLCLSKYFTHFFSEEEKENVIRRWCDFRLPIPTGIFKCTHPDFCQSLPHIVLRSINHFRFWYIDIPRTSSSSIKVELGKKYGIGYGKINSAGPERTQNIILPYHIPARMMQEKVGNDLWRRTFTFTLTRNPWDRMVSLFNYRKMIGNIPEAMLFRAYILELLKSRGTGLFKYYGFYYGNADYILGDNNEVLVNFIGKYETREDDLIKIGNEIGFPELGSYSFLSGKQDKFHYSLFYDDETRKIITEIYAKDIEMFNYTFEENI